MADRDIWEKGESLSKIFAAVLIPVVIGIAGLYANQALEKSKTRDELLRQAIDVVFPVQIGPDGRRGQVV
jgi:hypothetical protein